MLCTKAECSHSELYKTAQYEDANGTCRIIWGIVCVYKCVYVKEKQILLKFRLGQK